MPVGLHDSASRERQATEVTAKLLYGERGCVCEDCGNAYEKQDWQFFPTARCFACEEKSVQGLFANIEATASNLTKTFTDFANAVNQVSGLHD